MRSSDPREGISHLDSLRVDARVMKGEEKSGFTSRDKRGHNLMRGLNI
jgi:hypothetical protein